jgi:hypothetical protein
MELVTTVLAVKVLAPALYHDVTVAEEADELERLTSLIYHIEPLGQKYR